MADWKLNTDGGSRGNPGKAAWAFVLRGPDGQLHEHGGLMDMATNNSAEYEGVIQGLAFALAEGIKDLDVYSDSELIVKQIRGEYKVRHADLAQLHGEVKKILDDFSGKVTFHHVPREQNKEADKICNLVMDGKFRPALSSSKVSPKPSPFAAPSPTPLSPLEKLASAVGLTQPARPAAAVRPPVEAPPEETLAAVRAIFKKFGATISEDQAEEAIFMMKKVLGY